jgi:hypothetical protein
MNKTTKYLLIGGSILALGLVGYMILKPKKGNATPNNNVSENDDNEDDGYDEDIESELSFDEIEEICRYGDTDNPNYEKYCN